MREMKDSGIEWLGNIPELWCIKKLKYACEIYTGDSIKDDEKDLYTETLNAIPYISTKDIDANTNCIDYKNGLYIPVTNKKFKLAPKYSFLLCVEGGSAGKKIAYTAQDVNFVNKLCCFKSRKGTNSKFMYFYCQSDAFLTDFYLNMTGLIGGVSQSMLKNIRIATPHITQQQKIADYLDGECARIDGIVTTQRQIIERLKEYKKSVITEAVTRGLNPDAPMRNSGIDWIGKIPEHWEISKLKYYSKYITDGTHTTPEYLADGVPFLSIKDISTGKLDFSNTKYISQHQHEELSKHAPIEKGDILFTRIGTLGVSVIVETDITFDIFVSVGLLKPKDNINTKYLNYVMNSEYYYQYIQLVKAGEGTSAAKFNLSDVSNSPIVCPPLSEQQAIADYLDKECARIDTIIEKRERMIELMTEYKKSLIYECVTGKKEIVDVVE